VEKELAGKGPIENPAHVYLCTTEQWNAGYHYHTCCVTTQGAEYSRNTGVTGSAIMHCSVISVITALSGIM
jgi:hypothetical protein